MRILVDIDDTIADLLPAWLERYNDRWDDSLTPESITAWDMAGFVKKECGTKIFDILLEEDLYQSVAPIPGTLEGVNEIRKRGHEVFFVTAGLHRGKLQWLHDHGFLADGFIHDRNYVTSYYKNLIRADVIIDDKPDTVQTFPGFGILFSRPHNAYSPHSIRANNWTEVLTYLPPHMVCEICGGPDSFLGICSLCMDGIRGFRGSPQLMMGAMDYLFRTHNESPSYHHRTEIRNPNQSTEFLKILAGMYVTHLKKNADYSPANILGTGEIGLVTRVWDKVSRLLNLTGFDVDVRFVGYDHPREPNNESVNDNLMDLSVYGVIGLLLRKGAWGN